MEVFTLTAKARAAIWAQLNDTQLAVLQQYTLYASKSQLFNDIYAQGAHWRFVGVNIDYHWEQQHRDLQKFPHYYCQCGRVVKNQYVLEAVATPHKRIYLGVTHFAQELGIPAAVASEVRKRVNTIQMYMDEVLTYYKWGRRFPAARYQTGQALGVFNDDGVFAEKLADFARADFPLFHLDQQRFDRLLLRQQNQRTTPPVAPAKRVHSVQSQPVQQAAPPANSQSRVSEANLQLVAQFCGCSMADLRRHTLQLSAVFNELVFIAQAADCGIDVLAGAPELQGLCAQLHQQSLADASVRRIGSVVQRVANHIRREQDLFMRLAANNQTAIVTEAGRAQIKRILTQNAANQRRKHKLRTDQIARYQAELAKRVAVQYARAQTAAGDAHVKDTLEWQYTLQRLQERTLYEVGSGRIS
jgi:hypothetical protein